MAFASLRNLRLRHIYYSFNFQLSSSKFHCLPAKILGSKPLTSLSPEIIVDDQYRLLRAFSMNYRFFCATTTSPSVKPSSSSNVDAAPSSGSGEGNSGSRNDGGDNSGGSESASQQGKPVRGGEKKRHIEGINNASNAVRQGPSVGKAAIGGPFNLIDHNGKSVTDKDFLGKWNLIYFGFTHCPDICPDELQKLASAIDKIKEKSGLEVVPVFISVDPERDTVEQVREYVKEFHPKLIGLTGSPDEVKNAARAYRVYYMKTEEEGSDYLVDHSIVMYLMDPNMQFVKFFGKNVDTTSLADGVIQEIKQHKKLKA
ncbi:UNVERIFIED_CONTAM: protein SCO11, mitochondrial [Sesamum calycinum]|uniref:Protein SCO11, mitochondrial n=1 Tax=Sesamum calycinum TaxID=2727403 RepID=A0AAW2MZY1_9LAMI